MRSSIRPLLVIVVVVIVLAVSVLMILGQQKKKETLVVFHAGSLSIPLKDLKPGAERYLASKGYDVTFHFEASGSVMAVRKVTDLHKKADVLAVADYTLLRDMMYPEHADFYIAFATNELVLVYINKSKHSDTITSDNWFEVLKDPAVRFGFSNPNMDPCGYRALMSMKLADLYYGKPVFEELVERNTDIRAEGNRIEVPKDISVTGEKLVIRPKSVDLLALLESGSLDYAFEYRSVAVQHHLKYVVLPDKINLKNPSLKSWYEQVSVHLTSKNVTITALPIVYGITIPKGAPHRELALLFLKYLLTDGREIFKKNGQSFLPEPLAWGTVPDEIRPLVRTPS